MATHCSIAVWRIPWMRSLVGYSPKGHKEADTTEVIKHKVIRYRPKKKIFLATAVIDIESAVISVLPSITWRWLNPSTFPPPNHCLNKNIIFDFQV